MKYKHRGYRESERDKERTKKEPPKPRTPEERQLRHSMERSAKLVLRCYQCSADVPSEGIDSASICSGCHTAIHVCRNCANFDTGARWECKAAITEPVLDKTAANTCALFSANTVLDATGRRSGGATGGSDARALFENLFKKK